jgi:hypothetical protein
VIDPSEKKMKKAWRKPRLVIVHQAPPDTEDSRRFAQLIGLLSAGLERLLAKEPGHLLEPLDFLTNVTHECNVSELKDRTSQ